MFFEASLGEASPVFSYTKSSVDVITAQDIRVSTSYMRKGLRYMKNIPALLLEKGTSFYNFGSKTIRYFLIPGLFIIFFVLLGAGEGWRIDYLLIDGRYGFVNFLMALGYIGLIVGSVGLALYFLGLHYLGLGEISQSLNKLTRNEMLKDE